MKNFILCICFSFLFSFTALNADTPGTQWKEPWGTDAALVHAKPIAQKKKEKRGALLKASKQLIHFHKTVISPVDGPRSHYRPSSSMYTLAALKKYGFFWGWVKGCDRLMRENDEAWVYPTREIDGYVYKMDPVR